MKQIFFSLLLTASICGAGEFVDGKIGQGITGRHTFEPDVFAASKQGTAECWFSLDAPIQEIKDAMLFCMGTNAPGWFYVRFFKGGGISVNFKVGKDYYGARLNGLEFKEGQWHHLAITWGTAKTSFLKIYIDGRVKHQQFNTPRFPDSFSPGKFALGHNSGNYSEEPFPGIIDEMSLWSVPLPPSKILEHYKAGMEGKRLAPEPGCTFLASFEGNADFAKGPEADAAAIKNFVRQSGRMEKVLKYDDELEYAYRFEPEVKAAEGVLNDGLDSTRVQWNNRYAFDVILELSQTADLRLVEIVTEKFSKWNMMKELHVSFDDSSGEFGNPKIIQCYAFGKRFDPKVPNTDESCRKYIYTLENPGKANRVKVHVISDAQGNFGEIRLCGKTAK